MWMKVWSKVLILRKASKSAIVSFLHTFIHCTVVTHQFRHAEACAVSSLSCRAEVRKTSRRRRLSDINIEAARVKTDLNVEAARVEASGVTVHVACDDSGAVSAQGDDRRKLDGAEEAEHPEDRKRGVGGSAGLEHENEVMPDRKQISSAQAVDARAALLDGAGSPCGLLNLGASCYANSTLQCLSSCAAVRRACAAAMGQSGCGAAGSGSRSICKLADMLCRSARSGTALKPPVELLVGYDGQQEDAYIYCIQLFSHLKEVRDVCVSSVQHLLSCRHCGFQRAAREPEECTVLSVPVAISADGGEDAVDNIASVQQAVTTYLSTQDDVETAIDDWSCPTSACAAAGRQRSLPIKSLEVVQAPRGLLVVHLKRYIFTPGVALPRILDHRVELDRELWLDGKQYNLCAFLSHEGQQPHFGHYVAFVKKEDSWWLCNDSAVRRATAEEVRSGQRGDWNASSGRPYIVFYDAR